MDAAGTRPSGRAGARPGPRYLLFLSGVCPSCERKLSADFFCRDHCEIEGETK